MQRFLKLLIVTALHALPLPCLMPSPMLFLITRCRALE